MWGRRSCDRRGRGRSDVSKPGVAYTRQKDPEAKMDPEARKDPSPEIQREHSPTDTFISEFLLPDL